MVIDALARKARATLSSISLNKHPFYFLLVVVVVSYRMMMMMICLKSSESITKITCKSSSGNGGGSREQVGSFLMTPSLSGSFNHMAR